MLLRATHNRGTTDTLYTVDDVIGPFAKQSLSAHIGLTRNFQFWSRDPMGAGAAFKLSDAVSVSMGP